MCPVLQARENLPQATLLGPADEQDVARRDVIDSAVALDLQWPVVHCLAPHRFIQIRAERILPEDADDEGRVALGKGRGRPLDELSKVEEKTALT